MYLLDTKSNKQNKLGSALYMVQVNVCPPDYVDEVV